MRVAILFGALLSIAYSQTTAYNAPYCCSIVSASGWQSGTDPNACNVIKAGCAGSATTSFCKISTSTGPTSYGAFLKASGTDCNIVNGVKMYYQDYAGGPLYCRRSCGSAYAKRDIELVQNKFPFGPDPYYFFGSVHQQNGNSYATTLEWLGAIQQQYKIENQATSFIGEYAAVVCVPYRPTGATTTRYFCENIVSSIYELPEENGMKGLVYDAPQEETPGGPVYPNQFVHSAVPYRQYPHMTPVGSAPTFEIVGTATSSLPASVQQTWLHQWTFAQWDKVNEKFVEVTTTLVDPNAPVWNVNKVLTSTLTYNGIPVVTRTVKKMAYDLLSGGVLPIGLSYTTSSGRAIVVINRDSGYVAV